MKNLAIVILTAIFFFTGINANAQESVIPKERLPQKAQKFISDNYSKSTVDYVVMDKEFLSVDYKVRFTDGSEIEFNSDGEWVEVDGKKAPISTGFIAKGILSYVKQNFPNAQIIKIEKSRLGKQEVKLSNGMELEFNSKGKFIRFD